MKNKATGIGFANIKKVEIGTTINAIGWFTIAGGALMTLIGNIIVDNNTIWYRSVDDVTANKTNDLYHLMENNVK